MTCQHSLHFFFFDLGIEPQVSTPVVIIFLNSEIRSYEDAQAGLELVIVLLRPPSVLGLQLCTPHLASVYYTHMWGSKKPSK